MAREVWKFALDLVDGPQLVVMPVVATVVHVHVQADRPCLWADVVTRSRPNRRIFAVYATGQPVGLGWRYVGTAHIGVLAWHVYEGSSTLAAEESGEAVVYQRSGDLLDVTGPGWEARLRHELVSAAEEVIHHSCSRERCPGWEVRLRHELVSAAGRAVVLQTTKAGARLLLKAVRVALNDRIGAPSSPHSDAEVDELIALAEDLDFLSS